MKREKNDHNQTGRKTQQLAATEEVEEPKKHKRGEKERKKERKKERGREGGRERKRKEKKYSVNKEE